MKQIIIKSALATLGIVAGCAAIVFAVLSFGFPGTLCGWCEQLGNYGFAVKYASLCYSYTDDIADLARCAEDSVLSGKDGYIIEYCTMLVDDDDFDEYCSLRDEELAELPSFSYRQYIYGQAACAVYRGGDLELAIGYGAEALDGNLDRNAFSGNISDIAFPVNNALGTLALEVIGREDGSAAEQLYALLGGFSSSEAVEREYLDTLLGALAALL